MNLMKTVLEEKSIGWTWNYWPRNSPSALTDPYPDDMDDTACAIAALALWKPKIIDGKVLAHITQSLIITESRPGGHIFHTASGWLFYRILHALHGAAPQN